MTPKKKDVAFSPAFMAPAEPEPLDDPAVPQILPQEIEFVAGATVKDGYYKLDIKRGCKYMLPRRDVINLYSVCPSALPGDIGKRVQLWNRGR